MKISAINNCSQMKNSQSFGSNLWVDKSVEKVIQPNKKAFSEAAKKFDKWLKEEQKAVLATLTIRKNTALEPKVALEHPVVRISYAYPHEDSGYVYTERVKEFEDLEFELNNKKCGFWFNPKSNADELLQYFKNMFNYLSGNSK